MWAPDGQWLTFTSFPEGKGELWTAPIDGSSPPRALLKLDTDIWRGFWAPGGEWLVYRVRRPAVSSLGALADNDIVAVRPNTEEPPRTIAGGPFNEIDEAISPDGRWLAYSSNETGDYEVYVRPFPDTAGGRWLVSSGGGREPAWGKDGREVYYITPGQELAVVRFAGYLPFRASAPTILFSTFGYVSSGEPGYDVSPDGQHFLFIRPLESASGQLIVVQNFFDELRKRVPS
jgi:Tol biopolymer transport system component